MGSQENRGDLGGLASRGNRESQEPLASGRASEASKETRGSLGLQETQAKWATQGPLGPRGNKVP